MSININKEDMHLENILRPGKSHIFLHKLPIKYDGNVIQDQVIMIVNFVLRRGGF